MHISNKCSIAVHCLIFINEYGEENKVTSELLSLSTGCNPVTIRNIISAMKKDGISVHPAPSPFCPVGRNIGDVLDRTYDTLKENLISTMKSITMEKIVNDYHTILESDR